MSRSDKDSHEEQGLPWLDLLFVVVALFAVVFAVRFGWAFAGKLLGQ